MIWPPVDATASTAAANGGRKPVRFISGMVIGPSTMTLATALPDTVPNSADETIATLPGPPAVWPVIDIEKSMNSWPVPLRSMKARTARTASHSSPNAQSRPENAFGRQVELLHQHLRSDTRAVGRDNTDMIAHPTRARVMRDCQGTTSAGIANSIAMSAR